jgi:hypothetical protein
LAITIAPAALDVSATPAAQRKVQASCGPGPLPSDVPQPFRAPRSSPCSVTHFPADRSREVLIFDQSGLYGRRGLRPDLSQADLLFPLGMKRGFSCLHSRYQMFDPIHDALIGDHGRQALIMLDLAVEFDALGTHRNPAQIVKRSNPYWSPDAKTIESKDCSKKFMPNGDRV